MKNILVILIFLITITTSAKTWTNDRPIRFDLSQTNINIEELVISYRLDCSFKFLIEIDEGGVRPGYLSCGEINKELKVENGILLVPGIKEFSHIGGKKHSNYAMDLKIMYKGNLLFLFTSYKTSDIDDFYNKISKISFKQFSLKNVVLTYNGVNVIDAAEFDGKNTQVGIEFRILNSKYENLRTSNHFGNFFRICCTTYDFLSRSAPEAAEGKISLAPAYFAFINDEELSLTVTAGASGKHDSSRSQIIPFTQEALDQLKKFELKQE